MVLRRQRLPPTQSGTRIVMLLSICVSQPPLPVLVEKTQFQTATSRALGAGRCTWICADTVLWMSAAVGPVGLSTVEVALSVQIRCVQSNVPHHETLPPEYVLV